MTQERYLGTYGSHGMPQHTGELVIAEGDTRLTFIGRGLDSLEDANTIYGRTEKNEKVSCFDCFTTTSVQPFFDSLDHFERMQILPNITLVGEEHLDPVAHAIHEVRFKLSDTEIFFQDRNAIGSLFDVGAELQEIFDTRVPPIKKTAHKRSLISYFCGDFKIIECDTPLGIFSAGFNLEATSGHPFAHDVYLSLKFAEPIQFHGCMQRMGAIRRFFTVVTGRAQAYLRLELMVSRTSVLGNSKQTPLRVYFAHPPTGATSHAPSHFIDAPVHPVKSNEEFASVMQAWLSMDEARYMPRRQYVECIEDQSHYTTNRLVAAANMFDTLPADALPADVTLPPDFEDVVNETIDRLDKLPKTDFRNSLASYLGRLKRPSLPVKLYHRSSLICSRLEDEFPDLNSVLRIAGKFRNFLVHGGQEFDYIRYESFLPFLTDSLEFVFAASDLVDAGWNIERWRSANVWGDHQFTKFRRDYPQTIEAFMAAKNRPR